ncbi:hypothetical protein VTJ83DRAFT_6849 [Remersonia thermophila]|uniref:Zn(2)-C6 fungal-type domain-containing protein n=1 Tax=Remersonia thermophila TaxID=72144 RepID=A0ABR4D5W3_9PEZI
MTTTQIQVTPAPPKMLLYTRLAPPKQPKRRSRGGCTYCKEKKKKCDEARPKCGRCVEHGTECAYEPVKPRQRRRRESMAPGGDGAPDLHLIGRRRLSEASEYGREPDIYRREHGFFGGADDLLQHPFDDPILTSPTDGVFGDAFSLTRFPPPTYLLENHTSADDNTSKDDEQAAPTTSSSSTAVVPTASHSQHPDLAMVASCPASSPLLEFSAPVFVEFADRPGRRALVDHFCNVLSHLIVLREETGNPFQQLVLPLTRRESPVTYAMFALASAHLEYRGVENPEKSLYFHNMAIRGVAQLIQNGGSKANRNEILAAIMLLVYYECLVQKGHSNIVAGHLKGALTIMDTVPGPEDPTSVFLERAFRFYDVITALSNGTPPLSAIPEPGCLRPLPPLGAPPVSPLRDVDTLLGMATTLWPIIHRLAGLRAIKNDLKAAVRSNEPPAKIAALRSELETTAHDIEAALLQWAPQLPPSFVPDDLDLDDDAYLSGSGSDRSSSPSDDGASSVDPSSPTSVNADLPPPSPASSSLPRPSRPPLPHLPSPLRVPSRPNLAHPQSQTSALSSIHHNALAYRHASLVHLYRTALSRPRGDPSVQRHARIALRHCAATARRGGPVAALLWPLFVSACEVKTDADKALAEATFAEVERRQGMRNIERAWGILREVWRRRALREGLSCLGVGVSSTETGKGGGVGQGGGGEKEERDEEEEEELWRRVSGEMGVSIVFG